MVNPHKTTITAGRNGKSHGSGSYPFPLESRAIFAATMVRDNGWSQKRAAGYFVVNAAYVGLVGRLDEDERIKLARGEVTLSQLWGQYRRDLAERRAKRLAAEQAQAQVKSVTVDEAVAAWRSWSPGQRIAFGQGTGIAALWDGSIVPVMDAERGESRRVQITN